MRRADRQNCSIDWTLQGGFRPSDRTPQNLTFCPLRPHVLEFPIDLHCRCTGADLERRLLSRREHIETPSGRHHRRKAPNASTTTTEHGRKIWRESQCSKYRPQEEAMTFSIYHPAGLAGVGGKHAKSY